MVDLAPPIDNTGGPISGSSAFPTIVKSKANPDSINPLDRIDFERLQRAREFSNQKMKPFRHWHADAVRMFAGHRYGSSGGAKTPLNMLRLAIEVWSRQLVSQTPQALVLTRGLNTKIDAYELELAVNHLVTSLQFGDTLADIVRSAIFSLGAIKTGITQPYLSRRAGFHTSSGHIFLDQILFEDIILDLHARTYNEIAYIGNVYKVPIDSVLDNKEFNATARNHIDQTNKDQMSNREDNTSELTTGSSTINKDGSYHREMELCDLYLPGERLLVTMDNAYAQRPLQVREYDELENGPYRMLRFSSVPGNILPSAPAQHLATMQRLITTMFNQLSRQAERSKTVLLADGKSIADGSADRVATSRDGDVIHAHHPDGMKTVVYDGANPDNLKFVGWLKELTSYQAGNLDTMGGLAAGSRTIGQEQLLAQSSSEMLRDMQSSVINFTQHIFEDVAELLYADPTLQLQLTKNIRGVGDVPFTWTPNKRRANFFLFNFEVAPYSHKAQSPQQRLEILSLWLKEIVIPLAPQMAESGQQLDMVALVEAYSKYNNMPEMMDIVKSKTVRAGEQAVMPVARRPLQQPNTKREYVTHNSPSPEQESPATQAVMSADGAAPGGNAPAGPPK